MQGERRPLCVSEAAPVCGRRIWQAHNVSLCCSARGCKGGRRGGEATSRTRKFPNYVPAPGLRLPAAVLFLCSSDCDVVGKKTPNSGLATPQDLTVWLMSVIGKDHRPAPPFTPRRPPAIRARGGCGERARSCFAGGGEVRAAGGAGGGAGSGERRPGSFPPPGSVRCELAQAPTAH
nr:uncharacterized protein LOC123286671 [Equus asinus]